MSHSLLRFKLQLPSAVRARAGASPAPTSWSFSTPPVRRRAARWRAGVLLATPAALLFGTWLMIQSFPWFGPALADQLRAVVGSQAVTRLEELSASVEDGVRHALGGEPRGLAELTPVELERSATRPALATDDVPAFRPSDVGPLLSSLNAKQDGRWEPASLDAAANPLVYRTLLHPDPERAYAELFVFALDLGRVELHAVAGTVEPRPRAGERAEGAGVVPGADLERLLAAFNGGFKAEHGQFGMMVNGVELLAPRPGSCTVGLATSGALRVGTWRELEKSGEPFAWWRQTPACMVDAGELHAGLRSGASRSWGATLEGDTVIRRSALGLDAAGKTLYVAISNFTTARALAIGMQHAGATQVAQLDVNHSFPKFLMYRADVARAAPVAVGAVKGFLFHADDYVRVPSTRDFFYVTRR